MSDHAVEQELGGEELGTVEIDSAETERRVEALLFAAAEPLSVTDLKRRLPRGTDIEGALAALVDRYAGRGVELVCVGGGWRFSTAADLAFLMTEERHETKRLSKAAMETLSIIAYHQPVTRAEIEAVRGVGLSSGTLDLLLEVGWVRMRGRRRTPGRPLTFGTTEGFLEHFGLATLADLPGAREMKAQGLLTAETAAALAIPEPGHAESDEDPLDPSDTGTEFVQDYLGEG